MYISQAQFCGSEIRITQIQNTRQENQD